MSYEGHHRERRQGTPCSTRRRDTRSGWAAAGAATALVRELGGVAAELGISGVPTSLQIRLVAEDAGIPHAGPRGGVPPGRGL